MADDNDTPATESKPTPRRRAPRKTAPKSDASKPTAAKRASRPATSQPKKAAAKPAPKRRSTPKPSTTDRALGTANKAADAVGGKRNVGLIAGGLAVAGAAAAALLTLRGSTPKRKTSPAGKAHQPDGTDSSAQLNADIADENMIPETPKA